MEYTTNYQLPVWAETDRILRTDFNDAFDTIEDALSQHYSTLDTLETDEPAATSVSRLPRVLSCWLSASSMVSKASLKSVRRMRSVSAHTVS